MNLLKFLPILLVGCSTVSDYRNNKQNNPMATARLEYQIKNLERQVAYLEYEHINDICFLSKDTCDLKAFQICSYRQAKISKCQDLQQKICFKKHEQCIVDNFHRWESIKKAKGF